MTELAPKEQMLNSKAKEPCFKAQREKQNANG